MFKLLKKKHNVIKFTPCISLEEISDFTVRDILMSINEGNSLSIGFAGSVALKSILNKLAYNLDRQKLNYQNINFFNLMEFDDEKQQNIKFTFAKFVNAEFFNKLSQPVKNIHYLTNTKNNNITHWLKRNTLDLAIIEVGRRGDMCLFNSRYIKGHSSICDVKLSDATREEYAFLFDTNNIPHYGHAINIKHILKAKKIILVAYDLTKAPAVYNLLKHKIDSSFVVTKVIENKNVCLYADLQACQLAQD